MPVTGGGRVRVRGLWTAGERAVGWAGLSLLLVLVFWWWYVLAVQGSPGDWAFDFRQFWQGANDVVNGVSPYPSAALLATAGDHLDPEGIRDVFRFPYPAGAAVALAPLGLLGFHAAAAVWSALLIVSLLAAVWILGVRDWRVLAVVISSAPVISAVRLGTLTPLLVLLLAVAWRWRDRRWLAGGSFAFAIALKLFLWPLVVWLAATRRWAAAALAAVLAAARDAGGMGGDRLRRFRRLPGAAPASQRRRRGRGFSLVALGVEVGLPRGASGSASVAHWVLALGGLVAVARRDAGGHSAFSLAILASIALTPIVWLHYFALLVVPLALARPRLSWAWGLMWVFWLMPEQENGGDVWRIVLAVTLVAGVACVSAVGGRSAPKDRPAT